MYQWEAHNNTGGGGKKKGAGGGPGATTTSTTFHASDSFPTAFDSLPTGSILPSTVDRLKTKLGFTALLPAQARCYAHIHKGTDVVLHSRTGTGKTLAFVLPLIERELTDADRANAPRRGPFMVVLLPTVELAVQVQRVVNDVYGPTDVSAAAAAKPGGNKKKGVAAAAAATAAAARAHPVLVCRTAGIDVTDQAGLANVDILVGTIPSVDGLIRLRVDKNGGASSGGGKNGKQQQQQNGNGEDSFEEDDDEDDDDDLLAAMEDDEDDDNDDENKTGRTSGRRRNRSSADEASAAKQMNNKHKQQQQQQRNSSSSATGKRNSHHQPKKQFVCADAARYVRSFVIDEVDHTLGPKFSTSARRVHNMVKVLRSGASSPTAVLQCVVVGATIPDWIQRVGFLGDPSRRVTFRLVTAGTSKLPAGLSCFVVGCSREQDVRVDTACRLIAQLAPKRLVVFAPTKLVGEITVAIRRYQQQQQQQQQQQATLSPKLRGSSPTGNKKTGGAAAAAASSSSSAAAAAGGGAAAPFTVRRLDATADELDRLNVINEFNNGVANVLVCTDRACRGLDFTDVDTVICTSFPPPAPTAAETFVHRAGRAGRVGKPGRCVTLFDGENQNEATSKKMLESSAHVLFRPFEVTAPSLLLSKPNADAAAAASSASPAAKSAAGNKNTAKAAAAASSTSLSARVVMRLKVKNAFRATNAAAAAVSTARPATRTARDVLENSITGMNQELREAVHVQPSADDAPESVLFTVPRKLMEDVRAVLWKFDVSVVNAA